MGPGPGLAQDWQPAAGGRPLRRVRAQSDTDRLPLPPAGPRPPARPPARPRPDVDKCMVTPQPLKGQARTPPPCPARSATGKAMALRPFTPLHLSSPFPYLQPIPFPFTSPHFCLSDRAALRAPDPLRGDARGAKRRGRRRYGRRRGWSCRRI